MYKIKVFTEEYEEGKGSKISELEYVNYNKERLIFDAGRILEIKDDVVVIELFDEDNPSDVLTLYDINDDDFDAYIY